MAMFVAVVLFALTRYAGGWGVPYFSFTSERGSRCVNNLTGYVCDPMSLSDVEFFGDIDLPDDARVVTGAYTSTHDYRLEAVLEVPPPSAATAAKALRGAFGPCIRNHPSILDTRGLRNICVMASDDAYAPNGELNSRLYVVGTGTRQDGSRLISMVIHSA